MDKLNYYKNKIIINEDNIYDELFWEIIKEFQLKNIENQNTKLNLQILPLRKEQYDFNKFIIEGIEEINIDISIGNFVNLPSIFPKTSKKISIMIGGSIFQQSFTTPINFDFSHLQNLVSLNLKINSSNMNISPLLLFQSIKSLDIQWYNCNDAKCQNLLNNLPNSLEELTIKITIQNTDYNINYNIFNNLPYNLKKMDIFLDLCPNMDNLPINLEELKIKIWIQDQFHNNNTIKDLNNLPDSIKKIKIIYNDNGNIDKRYIIPMNKAPLSLELLDIEFITYYDSKTNFERFFPICSKHNLPFKTNIKIS